MRKLLSIDNSKVEINFTKIPKSISKGNLNRKQTAKPGDKAFQLQALFSN